MTSSDQRQDAPLLLHRGSRRSAAGVRALQGSVLPVRCGVARAVRPARGDGPPLLASPTVGGVALTIPTNAAAAALVEGPPDRAGRERRQWAPAPRGRRAGGRAIRRGLHALAGGAGMPDAGRGVLAIGAGGAVSAVWTGWPRPELPRSRPSSPMSPRHRNWPRCCDGSSGSPLAACHHRSGRVRPHCQRLGPVLEPTDAFEVPTRQRSLVRLGERQPELASAGDRAPRFAQIEGPSQEPPTSECPVSTPTDSGNLAGGRAFTKKGLHAAAVLFALACGSTNSVDPSLCDRWRPTSP